MYCNERTVTNRSADDGRYIVDADQNILEAQMSPLSVFTVYKVTPKSVEILTLIY